MKTIVIVGAGPGLGMAIGQKFGQNGFQVALVSRHQDKLDNLAAQLKSEGIEASGFAADLYNPEQLTQAFDQIKEKYGFIDVLEFSPTVGQFPPTPAMNVTADNALDQFQGLVLGAIHSVQQVLPAMLERQTGAILFTTGLSAIYPIPMMGNVGIALGGLRNYANNLHTDLAPKGIYVGHLSLGVFIKPDTPTDPKYIADAWYDMYEEKDKAEETFPVGVTPETIVW
ncbi:SDR family NAD(P)-dependent oxidoreductase [Paenibacillus marchantiae]|uniref:SDR family NAD(P)-dependent oxidoreductase n=1 Tax=Paenibacillus TaxID=44249 RepID=UPI00091E392A|nr:MULTISPECIES: SDR family oxidoreductase [Paenibacillus]WDQ31970.1 SDR family NAD(P)-dependent oxidoreductase [Paenibacillus marchantiae]SHN82678.1 short chain dehydrogenase [Paenibacillus sp. ov031]